MIRATTPAFRYRLPNAAENYSEFLVTMSQNNNILVSRRKSGLTIDGNTIQWTLTQQEANQFEAGKLAQVQLRAVLAGGTVVATPISNVVVNPALDDSILGGAI